MHSMVDDGFRANQEPKPAYPKKDESEKIIIVTIPMFMKPEDMESIYKGILYQRENGVILLPDYCKVVVAPKDIEIRLQEEKV